MVCKDPAQKAALSSWLVELRHGGQIPANFPFQGCPFAQVSLDSRNKTQPELQHELQFLTPFVRRPSGNIDVQRLQILEFKMFKMFGKCRFLGPNESIAGVGPGICILRQHPKGVRCRWPLEDALGNAALSTLQHLFHWPLEILKGSTLGSTFTLVSWKDDLQQQQP